MTEPAASTNDVNDRASGSIALAQPTAVAPDVLPVLITDARSRRPRATQRDDRARRVLLVADLLGLAGGLASWALLDVPALFAHVLWASLLLPLWVLVFYAYGLYAAVLRRVGYAIADDLPGLAHAFLVGTVAMWIYFRATPAGGLAFAQLLAFVLTAFMLVVLLRFAVCTLALPHFGQERVLFVGSGPMTPIILHQMRGQREYGLEPVGMITREENWHWPLALTDFGALSDVDAAEVIVAHRIDRVIVSAEGIEDDGLLELVSACRTLRVKIDALPSLAAMIGSAATIDHLEGITLIGLHTPSLARSHRLAKRLMDIVGAVLLLAASTPAWLLVAIAVKLDSPGPVLFRQRRIGKGGTPFHLTKFRSMTRDAEERRAALLAGSRQAGWLDLERDPRITRVGRFLRLTSLDELPQLWNVLRGDMSLVGPRPLIAEEDSNIIGWARRRLDLTPGITGVWQVMGRTQIPFQQMIMLDYLYVSNWSLWGDIKLIMQTVPVVFTRRGAN